MKTSAIMVSTLLGVLIAAGQPTASAQARRWVVISPRVGVVIDSTEASTYKIFQAVQDFHSGSVFQASDSSLWAMIQLRSADRTVRDTMYTISLGVLKSYAERIDHKEEMAAGSYAGGTTPPTLFCEDGSPIAPPPIGSVLSLNTYRHTIGADTAGRVLPDSPTHEWLLVLQSGETMTNYTITDMSDSLYVRINGIVTAISFDAVTSVERHKPQSSYWDRAFNGSLVGSLVGTIGFSGLASFGKSGSGDAGLAGAFGMCLGAVVGFIAGGSSHSAVDECYNLSDKTSAQKIETLKRTVGWNRPRPGTAQ